MIPNLREAREVWWCEEHEAVRCGYGHCLAQHPLDGPDVGDCRMVAKVLVDPAFVEWARSLFQECGQCKGIGHYRGIDGDFPEEPCPACNGSGQLLNEARLEAAAKAIYDAVYPDIDDAWEDTAIYDSPLADRHRREAKAAVLAFLGYEEE